MERFSYSRNGAGVDLKCSVRVSIPMVTKVCNKVHYKVAMKTTHVNPPKSWEVLRPYSHFAALRKELLLTFKECKANMCPGCKHYEKAIVQFDFPRKHLFSSTTTEVLRHRQLALQAFVAMLASHTFTTAPRCPTCSGRVFELVRDFLTTEVGAANVDNPNDEASSSVLDEETRRSAFAVDNFVEFHTPSADVVVDSNGDFVDSPTKRRSSPSEGGAAPLPPPPATNTPTGSKKRSSFHSFGSGGSNEDTSPSTENSRSSHSDVSSKPAKVYRQSSVSDLANIHLDDVRPAQVAGGPCVDDDEGDLNMDFMAHIATDPSLVEQQ
ncbi:hypothetical protein DYB36_003910 [Aphanomyces astaci]|uniref:PX domain-containing protein n=1 Tax=Aphanomyces astaci TaxID=112090 RepID=A0A397AHD5_APHAT|nr:hypothetical protein DYB36_003910 [Aphanomyces astaci]